MTEAELKAIAVRAGEGKAIAEVRRLRMRLAALVLAASFQGVDLMPDAERDSRQPESEAFSEQLDKGNP